LKSIGKYLSDINFVNKNEIISKIELTPSCGLWLKLIIILIIYFIIFYLI